MDVPPLWHLAQTTVAGAVVVAAAVVAAAAEGEDVAGHKLVWIRLC